VDVVVGIAVLVLLAAAVAMVLAGSAGLCGQWRRPPAGRRRRAVAAGALTLVCAMATGGLAVAEPWVATARATSSPSAAER
jgi:uncharacterized membrane protein